MTRVLGPPLWSGQWATVIPYTTPGPAGPLYPTPPTLVTTGRVYTREYGTRAVDSVDEIEPHVKAHYVLSGIPEVQGGHVVVYQVTPDNVDLGPAVRVAVVDTHPQLDPLVQLALDELVTEYLLPRMPRGATWDKFPAS